MKWVKRRSERPAPSQHEIPLSRPNARLDTQTLLPLLKTPKDAQELSDATHYPLQRVQHAMLWAIEHGRVTSDFQFRNGTLVEMWKRVEEP
jgi:hypothetical protein